MSACFLNLRGKSLAVHFPGSVWPIGNVAHFLMVSFFHLRQMAYTHLHDGNVAVKMF